MLIIPVSSMTLEIEWKSAEKMLRSMLKRIKSLNKESIVASSNQLSSFYKPNKNL